MKTVAEQQPVFPGAAAGWSIVSVALEQIIRTAHKSTIPSKNYS